MIPLIAGIGIGSILAAVIGWFVAISNHRQAWINSLRDDIATYLKEIEKYYYTSHQVLLNDKEDRIKELAEKNNDARSAVLFIYSRILLRLNRNEALHISLASKLNQLRTVLSETPDSAQINELVMTAQDVLKREWEVTKFGPLAKPIMCWRGRK